MTVWLQTGELPVQSLPEVTPSLSTARVNPVSSAYRNELSRQEIILKLYL